MLIGIALGSTLEVMPYTGYPISQNLARTLFWISIGMLLFGVALVIIALVSNKQKASMVEERIREDIEVIIVLRMPI